MRHLLLLLKEILPYLHCQKNKQFEVGTTKKILFIKCCSLYKSKLLHTWSGNIASILAPSLTSILAVFTVFLIEQYPNAVQPR